MKPSLEFRRGVAACVGVLQHCASALAARPLLVDVEMLAADPLKRALVCELLLGLAEEMASLAAPKNPEIPQTK